MNLDHRPKLADDDGLLATDASIASSAAGPCSLCGGLIPRGHRYAVAVATGRAAHMLCIVQHQMN